MSTRRDFLAMLLGAPLAYACRGDAARRIPPGALVDTGMARGHATIRDAAALPAITTWRRARAVVVGSGVAGLAAAWQLRRDGVRDVVMLELDHVAGGTARGGASAVTPYPWGAHYIVAPQRDQTDLIALLSEMNAIEGHAADGTPIVDELLRCREPEERVWYLGRWWDGLYLDAGASPEDRRQLTAFMAQIDHWASWRDSQGRRAFAIPRSRGSDYPAVTALDQQSFATWLDERGFTSPRLRWLCDYACRDDYALSAAQTSAWAGIFYFAGRQSTAGVDAQPVVTWPDGNGALVRHLADGAQIESDVAVLDIEDPLHVALDLGGGTGGSGSAGIAAGSAGIAAGSAGVAAGSAGVAAGSAGVVAGPGGRGSLVRVTAIGPQGPFGIEADAVIVATPTFVANRIVRARRGQAHGDYGAWVVANVHLRDRPRERGRGAPPAWDNVFRDSPSLGYVCATHQRGRDRGPTVWTWYYPFTDEDARGVRTKLAGAGYAEWADVILTDIGRAHPDIRDKVDHIEVAFWGHGMVRPRPGSVWAPDLRARSAPIGRIHFAHTDLSGYALFEEAFDHGLRAARAVTEALRS